MPLWPALVEEGRPNQVPNGRSGHTIHPEWNAFVVRPTLRGCWLGAGVSMAVTPSSLLTRIDSQRPTDSHGHHRAACARIGLLRPMERESGRTQLQRVAPSGLPTHVHSEKRRSREATEFVF